MTLSDAQKSGLLLSAFLGVIGLVLVGYFHFMFGRGMIAANERQRTELAQKIPVLKKDLAQIQELVAQKEELERQVEMINKVTQRLPSSPDAPGFLNALLTSLSTTGIVQEKVAPANTQRRALYTEIPYEVEALGHYHAIGQFLTLIEQNPERFMRLRDLRITNNPNRPSIHPFAISVTTFMFNP